MKRRNDLLRAASRRLFWQQLAEWLARFELTLLQRRNRNTARQLEKRGML